MDNSADGSTDSDRKRKRDEKEDRAGACSVHGDDSKGEERAVVDRPVVVRRPDPPTDDEEETGSPPQHHGPRAQIVGSNGGVPSPRPAAAAAAGIRRGGIPLAAIHQAPAPQRQVSIPVSVRGLFPPGSATPAQPNQLLLQYLAIQQQQQQQPTHPVDPRNVFQRLELQQRQRQQQQTLQQSQEQQIRMLQQQLAHYQQLAAAQELRLRQHGLSIPTIVPPTAGAPLQLSAIVNSTATAPLPMAAPSSIVATTSTTSASGRSRTVTATPTPPRPVIATPNPKLTGRPPVVLYLESDPETLSPYQCLARKHMELFEALPVDVEGGAQGRNKPIVIGQVGVRCKWCTHLPLKERLRASSYYPARLQGLYQAAQNILNGHLFKDCRSLPDNVRQELMRLQTKKSGPGGGKHFWSECAMKLGVFEDEHGLRFHPWGASTTATTTAARQQEARPADTGRHQESPTAFIGRHQEAPKRRKKKEEEGPPKEDPPSISTSNEDDEEEEEATEDINEAPQKDDDDDNEEQEGAEHKEVESEE